jgi:hypothetical protein
MQDFTVEIPKALKDDEAAEVHNILARLREFGFANADIESVMDVLTARADPNRAKRSIGPRLIEFAEKVVNKTSDIKANVLLERIKEQIEARCARASFQQSDARYEKFFSQAPLGTINGVPTHLTQIFTTNYDLCVDKFLRRRGYVDGFEERVGYGRIFTGSWARSGVGTYSLCKLHGSVNWFEIGGLITQLSFAPGQSYMDEQVTGRMMVYPASEKYALITPYAECLVYLRASLMERSADPVVVIGYSFRDSPINNAFVDAIKANPSLRIFALSRLATAHQHELEEPLRSRVIPVEGDFASDKSLDDLNNAIRGQGPFLRPRL